MSLKGALTHHRNGGAVRSPRVQTVFILKQTAVMFCLHFEDVHNADNQSGKKQN